jgi:cation:H+ antiporter
MIIFYILILLALIFLLIKSADLVVDSLRKFSKMAHAKVVVVSSILLAIATSFPELVIGVSSAINKSPDLTLGNILGANIANISLVAGLSALIAGGVIIHNEFIRREVFTAAIAGLIPIVLVVDGSLTRIDGIILLLFYIAYSASFFKDRFMQIAHENRLEGYIHRFIRNIEHPKIDINFHAGKELIKMIASITLLILVASVVVKIAVTLATSAGIPIFIVGLVLLSMGTTLPELAFSIRSLKNHQPTMFFGNILGSIICNSTLILGLTAVIYPIKLANPIESLIAAVAFVLIFGVFWIFIRERMRIGRKEALVLVILYAIFVALEFFFK